MIATLTESLLPGLRSLRAPLFAGIGWSVLFWLAYFDQITDLAKVDGWVKQAFELIHWIGPVGAGTIAAITVFIVGAVATTVTEMVARTLGNVLGAIAFAFKRQRKLQSARRELVRNLRAVDAERKALKDQTSPRADAVRVNHAELQARSARFRGAWGLVRRVWIRSGRKNLAALRPELASTPADVDLERDAIVTIRRQAIRKELLKNDGAVVSRVLEHRQIWLSDEVIGLSRDLRRELGDDPLDATRMIDQALFNHLDKERSERQVRLALSFPLAGLAVFLWLHDAVLPGAIVGAFSLAMMLRFSVGARGERARILNFWMLRGTPTPSMKAAYQSGQLDARMQAETAK